MFPGRRVHGTHSMLTATEASETKTRGRRQ
jgi:hypothetical protein